MSGAYGVWEAGNERVVTITNVLDQCVGLAVVPFSDWLIRCEFRRTAVLSMARVLSSINSTERYGYVFEVRVLFLSISMSCRSSLGIVFDGTRYVRRTRLCDIISNLLVDMFWWPRSFGRPAPACPRRRSYGTVLTKHPVQFNFNCSARAIAKLKSFGHGQGCVGRTVLSFPLCLSQWKGSCFPSFATGQDARLVLLSSRRFWDIALGDCNLEPTLPLTPPQKIKKKLSLILLIFLGRGSTHCGLGLLFLFCCYESSWSAAPPLASRRSLLRPPCGTVCSFTRKEVPAFTPASLKAHPNEKYSLHRRSGS